MASRIVRNGLRGTLLAAALLVAQSAGAGEGAIVFSKTPIDPASPASLTTSFQAGDHIYGLMMPKQTWRQLYGAKAKTKAMLLLMWTIDGKKQIGGYINIVDPKGIDSKHMVFDIAPAVDKMTAYRDPGVVYGIRRGIKKGACQFTLELSKLTPGKHTMEFWVHDYGKKHVAGSFEIQGGDYRFYADLHAKIKAEIAGSRTMPAAKKTDKTLAAEMTKLLKNAGWPNVLRLNIVDRDWWLDRVAGGDTPIKSRHMAAAAAYKDKDGKCYYRVCTFHQHKTLTGAFGPLELTHQGKPVSIQEANIHR